MPLVFSTNLLRIPLFSQITFYNEMFISVFSETNEGRNGRTRNDWRLGTKSASRVDGQQWQPERKQQ